MSNLTYYPEVNEAEMNLLKAGLGALLQISMEAGNREQAQTVIECAKTLLAAESLTPEELDDLEAEENDLVDLTEREIKMLTTAIAVSQYTYIKGIVQNDSGFSQLDYVHLTRKLQGDE